VLLGNGDGSFQDVRFFSAGTVPVAPAVADFNGDNVADLAVANYESSNVSVLLGVGDGSFLPAQNLSTTSHPRVVAVSDFNGDGIQDLAISCGGDAGHRPEISILLGAGGGTFQPAQHILKDVVISSALAAGDLNGDGKPDLVAPPGVLLGNGDGTFQTLPLFANIELYSQFVVAGELNGDGRLDFVMQHRSDISVRLSNGDGTFFEAPTYAAGSYPTSVAVADFNRDGVLDLAVTDVNSYLNARVFVRLGNADGTFGVASAFSVGGNPTAVAAADFNGDAIPDLAVVDTGIANTFGDISILIGNGDGTFQAAQTFSTGKSPMGIVVTDFNLDGVLDLAVANRDSDTISVLLGNGDGTFQTALTGPAGVYPDALASGDFDGDGIPDLAVANEHNIYVMRGFANGGFTIVQVLAQDTNPLTLAIDDVNADGKLDLLIGGGYPREGVSVSLGNGDGTFQESAQTFAAGYYLPSLAVGDFNHDGRLDVAAANEFSDDVSLLAGNGDGTFQPPLTFRAGLSPMSAAAGDFNHDGKLDLVVANYRARSVSVLINDTAVVPIPQSYSLTVNRQGNGGGTVTSSSSPPGSNEIDCGETCTANYAAGTIVTLTAQAHAGSALVEWAGCESVSGTTCMVTMDTAKSVTATFALQQFILTVTKSATGNGDVTSTSNPPGATEISCGDVCGAAYDWNTAVTLSAQAAVGSVFVGWAGCDAVSGTTCTVTMDAAKSVTATFALQRFTLSVTKGGIGNGTVMSTSNPPRASQISCGAVCSAAYDWSTVVTLSATPAFGNLFFGWSGCDAVSGSRCVVTMQSAKSVKATFVGVPAL
jgi:hypothetical protein